MSQVTLTLPSVDQVFAVDSRGWLVIAVLLVTAVVASVSLSLYRKHYSAKKCEELAKHWTAILLTAFSGLLSLAAYVIVLAGDNQSLLRQILSGFPFVEKHVFTVVGIAYVIYNLKNNKITRTVLSPLSRWSGAKDPAQTPVTAVPLVATADSQPQLVAPSEDQL